MPLATPTAPTRARHPLPGTEPPLVLFWLALASLAGSTTLAYAMVTALTANSETAVHENLRLLAVLAVLTAVLAAAAVCAVLTFDRQRHTTTAR